MTNSSYSTFADDHHYLTLYHARLSNLELKRFLTKTLLSSAIEPSMMPIIAAYDVEQNLLFPTPVSDRSNSSLMAQNRQNEVTIAIIIFTEGTSECY